ncbi:MAG: LptA/OstA family protein [Lentisphaeria bacterium]|jgi:lipopolysaccharide transport protein LptA|nr:LptA/OstA family protein [Lentisphaeria bacterium]
MMAIPKRAILALAALLAIANLPAQTDPVAEKPGQKPEEAAAKKMSELEIISDSVEMDFENRRGTFVGNVKVSDESMLLLADKMIVHLTEANELRMIEALGNVTISEVGTQKKATAGKAVFDAQTDMVVLSESPALADPVQWTLTRAHLITYNRAKGTFTAERSAEIPIRITFLVPEGKGGQTQGFLPGLGGPKEEKEKDKQP